MNYIDVEIKKFHKLFFLEPKFVRNENYTHVTLVNFDVSRTNNQSLLRNYFK